LLETPEALAVPQSLVYSPIVEMKVVLKLFSENLNKMHVFPTPVTKSRERITKLHKKKSEEKTDF
jgi:hypothetical protein